MTRTCDTCDRDELKARLAELESLLALVYDGHAVFSRLSEKARRRTSAENVADTLDALNVAWKAARSAERTEG